MKEVIILTNPVGVEAIAEGKKGTIIKQGIDKAEIEFINEFGEPESWYFRRDQYRFVK